MATKFETLSSLKDSLTEEGFLFLKRSEFGAPLNEGLVEINEEMKEGNKIACRITQSGLDWLKSFETEDETEIQTQHMVEKTTEPKKVKPMFEILSAPIPPAKARGRVSGKSSKYPFEALEVGSFFFVPADETKPEPWKSLASIVSDANRRYAVEGQTTRINRKGEEVPVLVYTRKFVLREYTHNGVHGAGIWREA